MCSATELQKELIKNLRIITFFGTQIVHVIYASAITSSDCDDPYHAGLVLNILLLPFVLEIVSKDGD